MRGTIDDLRPVLREKRPRGKCPSPEEFVRFFSREASEEKSGLFLDHIRACPSCRREFDILSRLSVRAEPLLAGLEKIRLTAEENMQLRGIAGAKLRHLRAGEGRFSWFRSPPGRMVSLGAAGLLLVLASLFLLRRPERTLDQDDLYRGGDELTLDLTSPRGETSAGDLVFIWRSYSGAETYEFKLLNPDLSLLWGDGVLRRTRLELPPRVRTLLRRKAIYLWKVTAYDAAGLELGSGLQSFRLR